MRPETPNHTLQRTGVGSLGVATRTVRTALLAFLSSAALYAAEPPASTPQAVPKTDGWREMEQQWRSIEPELFTPDAAKKHIGTWVRFSGTPTSLRSPVTLKLASGTVARLTKLQGADNAQLAKFRKPPSVVTVYGPIVAVDAATHTVTIKAVSTSFDQ